MSFNTLQKQEIRGLIAVELEKKLPALKSELSEGFKKQFTELAAKSVKTATEGIDPETVPIATDPAVWLGGKEGSELYRWRRKQGDDLHGPVVVKARRPPVEFFDGRLPANTAQRKAYGEWMAELGLAARDLSSGTQPNAQHMGDWVQAKAAIYERQTGYPWQDTMPKGEGGASGMSAGFVAPDLPAGPENPETVRLGGGAEMTGTTEVPTGMGGEAGGGSGG